MVKRLAKTGFKATRMAEAAQLEKRKGVGGGNALPRKLASRGAAAVRSEHIPPHEERRPARGRQSVPATQAKNRFGEILQTARDTGPVFIERHGQAQAVVLGIEAYNKLASNERSSHERELDYWTREFDALHARMQSTNARRAVDDLFSATDSELNRRDT
jgi:prevent-host-death family protein